MFVNSYVVLSVFSISLKCIGNGEKVEEGGGGAEILDCHVISE